MIDYSRIEEIFGALISNPLSIEESSKEFEMSYKELWILTILYFLSSKYVRNNHGTSTLSKYSLTWFPEESTLWEQAHFNREEFFLKAC